MISMMNKEVENIITKNSYLTPSRYTSGRIVEYDIRSANISVLRNSNIISEEEYYRLRDLPKMEREKAIGLMIQKDTKIYEYIKEGIIQAKLELVKNNPNITPMSIVRVANDAVYINSQLDLENTSFGNYIFFAKKNEFSHMLILDKIIILLGYLPDGNINVDIKGINKHNQIFHQNYMINFIISTIVILDRSGVKEAINYMTGFVEQYLHLNLPVDYYREFNANSQYRLRQDLFRYFSDSLTVDNLDDFGIYHVDINFNYYIIRELWSILLNIYSREVR